MLPRNQTEPSKITSTPGAVQIASRPAILNRWSGGPPVVRGEILLVRGQSLAIGS